MNEKALDLLNAHTGDWPVIDALARFFAGNGIYLLGLVALVFGLLEMRRDRRRGVRIGVAAVLALCLAGMVVLASGLFVVEARPFAHDSDTVLLVKHGLDNSFPSDHATVAAAAAVVAALAWRRWAALFLLGAVLVGLARVYAGIHYPGDVVGGWIIGGAAAVAAWQVSGAAMTWRRLQPALAR
jgi:undecaprenyl-diphosphatase